MIRLTKHPRYSTEQPFGCVLRIGLYSRPFNVVKHVGMQPLLLGRAFSRRSAESPGLLGKSASTLNTAQGVELHLLAAV